VLKTLMKERIAAERGRGIDDGPKVEIRLDAVCADERGTPREHRGFGRVSTDRGHQRELFESLGERDS
jgi:hypothetical protein